MKKFKHSTRVLIAIAIGFVIAMLIMTIFIWLGYSQAYDNSLDKKEIVLFGLNIYEITKNGSEYIGQSQGVNMGIFCMIFITISVAVQEVLYRLKAHDKPAE